MSVIVRPCGAVPGRLSEIRPRRWPNGFPRAPNSACCRLRRCLAILADAREQSAQHESLLRIVGASFHVSDVDFQTGQRREYPPFSGPEPFGGLDGLVEIEVIVEKMETDQLEIELIIAGHHVWFSL